MKFLDTIINFFNGNKEISFDYQMYAEHVTHNDYNNLSYDILFVKHLREYDIYKLFKKSIKLDHKECFDILFMKINRNAFFYVNLLFYSIEINKNKYADIIIGSGSIGKHVRLEIDFDNEKNLILQIIEKTSNNLEYYYDKRNTIIIDYDTINKYFPYLKLLATQCDFRPDYKNSYYLRRSIQYGNYEMTKFLINELNCFIYKNALVDCLMNGYENDSIKIAQFLLFEKQMPIELIIKHKNVIQDYVIDKLFINYHFSEFNNDIANMIGYGIHIDNNFGINHPLYLKIKDLLKNDASMNIRKSRLQLIK